MWKPLIWAHSFDKPVEVVVWSPSMGSLPCIIRAALNNFEVMLQDSSFWSPILTAFSKLSYLNKISSDPLGWSNCFLLRYKCWERFLNHRTSNYLAQLSLQIFSRDVVDLDHSPPGSYFPGVLMQTLVIDDIKVKLPVSSQLSSLVHFRHKKWIYWEVVAGKNKPDQVAEKEDRHSITVQVVTCGKPNELWSMEQWRRKTEKVDVLFWWK